VATSRPQQIVTVVLHINHQAYRVFQDQIGHVASYIANYPFMYDYLLERQHRIAE